MEMFVKILLSLLSVVCMVIPYWINYVINNKQKSSISYKRFRIVVFALLFGLTTSIVFAVIGDVMSQIGQLAFVKKIASLISVSSKTEYCARVIAVAVLNVIISAAYVVLQQFVKIGLAKKKLTLSNKNGVKLNIPLMLKKFERKLIKFFHNETYFFIGELINRLCILLSIVYAVGVLIMQLPAISGSGFLPYEFLESVVSSTYIYPSLTLIMLWEISWFLSGVKTADAAVLGTDTQTNEKLDEKILDLNKISGEYNANYKDMLLCEILHDEDGDNPDRADQSAEAGELSGYIRKAVADDMRTPKNIRDIFVKNIDRIVESNDNIIIKGGFYTEFGIYFLRYLNSVLAKGDNVIFVCNTDEQINAAYEYVKYGLSEISSLYYEGNNRINKNWDFPIWQISRTGSSGNMTETVDIDNSSVLISTLDYICSADFENNHKGFIQLTGAMIYTDIIESIIMYPSLLKLANTRLSHLTHVNAKQAKEYRLNNNFQVKYIAHPIRSFYFDDTAVPELEHVLENMLSLDITTVDCSYISDNVQIKCFKFEGVRNEDGLYTMPQIIRSDNEYGIIPNMVILGLSLGAPYINVYPNGSIPYTDILTAINSEGAKLYKSISEKNFIIDRYNFNNDDYKIIIAVDNEYNLPAAIRKYAKLTGSDNNKTLVYIISKPYMLRDYFSSQINDIWDIKQMMRLPTVKGTDKDIALNILTKANAGGIPVDELCSLAGEIIEMKQYAEHRNINKIMCGLLNYFGTSVSGSDVNFSDYFEYKGVRELDGQGNLTYNNIVQFRDKKGMYDIVAGKKLIKLKITNDNTMHYLSLSKDRLTQNYIIRQNMLYNGNVYCIDGINLEEGKISMSLNTNARLDVPYEYIQSRKYYVAASEYNKSNCTYNKLISFDRTLEDVTVGEVEIYIYRIPMLVVTDGYAVIRAQTSDRNLNTMQKVRLRDDDVVCRRYGNLPQCIRDKESAVITKGAHEQKYEVGVKVLSLKMKGEFAENGDKTAYLAAVILNEIFKTMYPGYADSVVALPVISGAGVPSNKNLKYIQPELSVMGDVDLKNNSTPSVNNCIELLIVEDCNSDMGIISSLISSGQNPAKTLFKPIMEYLNWYFDNKENTNKDSYLNFGDDTPQNSFDFITLKAVAQILADKYSTTTIVDIEDIIDYNRCDFCGRKFIGSNDTFRYNNERLICEECRKTIVGNDPEKLKSIEDEAKKYLEKKYQIKINENRSVVFKSTSDIDAILKSDADKAKRGGDISLKGYIGSGDDADIYIEKDIPKRSIQELLVRQLTHSWQDDNLKSIDEELAEGQIALVGIEYLRYLSENELANYREVYYDSDGNDSISCRGYRRLKNELKANPKYKNNSFRYLSDITSGSSAQFNEPSKNDKEPEKNTAIKTQLSAKEAFENMKEFYYERLPDKQKQVYRAFISAIKTHSPECQHLGLSRNELKNIHTAIQNDHPELYYYITLAYNDDKVMFNYGLTEEEINKTNADIEAVIPRFTTGIDDGMSDYDKALRIYTNLINNIHYDSKGLNKERRNKNNEDDKQDVVDRLRTVCGALLDGRAVCAGYARAMQYLLALFGIECTYCVGDMLKSESDDPSVRERHAWNIIKLDGEYYHCDVTWGDYSDTIQSKSRDGIDYSYFCVTTDEITRTRTIDCSVVEIPEYTATKCNYFVKSKAIIDTYDINKIIRIAKKQLRLGMDIITFKCTDNTVFEEVVKNFLSGEDLYQLIREIRKIRTDINDDATYQSYPNEKILTVTICLPQRNS